MRPTEFHKQCARFNWAWEFELNPQDWGDKPSEEHRLRAIAEERPELARILEQALVRFGMQRAAAQKVQ